MFLYLSQKTTFTFPSPVFLKSGMEYCFVVWSDSDEYECWFQRGGGKDIANDSIVIGPPADHMGSMFVFKTVIHGVQDKKTTSSLH